MKPPRSGPTSRRDAEFPSTPAPRGKRDTSTRVELFRPNNDVEYAPDLGSSLREMSKQGRGETQDERSLQDIAKHTHDGANSKEIEFGSLVGLIRTVTVAPTHIPTRISEQIVLYYSGGTARIYFYDTINKAWRSVT